MSNLKPSDIVSLGIILMFMASLSPRALFYTQEDENMDKWAMKSIKGYIKAQDRMWKNWKNWKKSMSK